MRPLAALAALLLPACALAQDAEIDPALTEAWTPVPAKVTPGESDDGRPSDAVDLLAGLDGWESVRAPGPAGWKLENGELVVEPGTGDIRTRAAFGDAQLHIEWMVPELPADKTGQDRGNSGIFLQERYELQVLDSFTNVTYSNGQAGSIYKQFVPLVNATRPAAQWQSYDIVFTAPRFGPDGALVSPAEMTVFHNGVLIQNDAELKGPTVYRGPPSYGPAHGDAPLLLQDHGHKVRFRNMWLRRL